MAEGIAIVKSGRVNSQKEEQSTPGTSTVRQKQPIKYHGAFIEHTSYIDRRRTYPPELELNHTIRNVSIHALPAKSEDCFFFLSTRRAFLIVTRPHTYLQPPGGTNDSTSSLGGRASKTAVFVHAAPNTTNLDHSSQP